MVDMASREREQHGHGQAGQIGQIARLTFGQALEELKRGKQITREGWRPGIAIVRQLGHLKAAVHGGAMLAPPITIAPHFVHVEFSSGTHTPGWIPCTEDLFAEDWHVIT